MPLRNILIIALTAVFAMACYSVAARNQRASLVAEAMHLIETEALYDVPAEDLFKAAMKGMTDQLDDHSIFIAGDEFKVLDEEMNQQFGGVGMFVGTDPVTDQLVVLAPIPDSPAFDAGIKIGDQIIRIGDKLTTGLDRSDAVPLMRGPEGTVINVGIRREGDDLDFDLKRSIIPLPSVTGDWRNPDGTWMFQLKDHREIGYIRLAQFGKKSTEEMRTAVSEMNGEVKGLIIDLRNNAGGLLNSAIDICDMFLAEKKVVVRTRGRDRKLLEQHSCTASHIFDPQIPIVILVNRNSASASEVVAGCLQDYGRAVIVGEQTYGKGTVQHLIPMQRGRSVLKLTVASFWRPSEQQIDKNDPVAKEKGVWGIQPDENYAVDLSREVLFENIRQRNLRDLAGLNPDIYQSAEDLFGSPAAQQNREDGQEDTDEPGAEENPAAIRFSEDGEYIDPAIEKAIEYFQKGVVSKAAA